MNMMMMMMMMMMIFPSSKFKILKSNESSGESSLEAVTLNRPSWLLGKWKNIERFIDKTYYNNEWMDKLQLE